MLRTFLKFFSLTAFFGASLFFLKNITYAQTVFTGGGTDGGLKSLLDILPGSGLIQSDDIIAVTLGWIKFALALLGTIAFVAFIWAGFLYITAFANEEGAESAKKIMQSTAIGIIVILMSYAIVATLIRATVGTP